MSGSSVPKAYSPSGQSAADQQYQGLTSSAYPYISQTTANVAPQAQALSQQLVSNPYAAQQQTGANAAASTGANQIAPQEYAASSNLQALGDVGANSGYASQILQQGFDPQQALYNQQYQQTIDQQNAINAMYGLGSSPYGAGVTGQVGNNFNLNWQNQQLGRENTAITGYDNLASGAANAYTGASNLGNAGLQTATTAANLPYLTSAGQAQTGLQGLGSYAQDVSSAYAPASSQIGNLAQYLSLGQSSTALNQQAAESQNASLFSGLGGLGSLLGQTASNPLSLFGTSIW